MRKTKDVLRWARRIVVLGLSISPIAHAQTATTVIDTKAAASGQCSDFGTPQTNLHSCDEKVFYIHYSNGRVSFIVQKTFSDEDQKNDPTGEYRAGRKQVVMFSGSRDQQNHPEDYYLYVDNVSINLYDVSDNSALGNNEVPVSGNCHLVGNAEMSHIQRITCSATYGKSRQQSVIGFAFTSDGKNLEVSHPFRIPPQDRRGARGIQQLDPNRPIGKVWLK